MSSAPRSYAWGLPLPPGMGGRRVSGLLLFGLLAVGCQATALHEVERELTVPYVEQTGIEVHGGRGAVSVLASDREDVHILAQFRAASRRRLDNCRVVADRSTEQTLVVEVRWPGGKPREGEECDLQIEMPAAHGVLVRSLAGDVKVTGMQGLADLHTRNGKIEVRTHEGAVTAKTSNGMVQVDGATGAVDLSSTNGPIAVVGARQQVQAETTNGNIRVACRPEGTGPVQLKTSNGSIDLLIGPHFRGRLTAATANGRVLIDSWPGAKVIQQSTRSVQIQFQQPGAASGISTNNGVISLKTAS